MARTLSKESLTIPFFMLSYFIMNMQGVSSTNTSFIDKIKNIITGGNTTVKPPTGIELVASSFLKVYQSKAFVDKTLFIKYFMEDQKYSLLTAPKRFGKSTNVDMLFIFLRLQVDKRGVALTQSKAEYYDLFTSGKLKISQQPEFVNRHFAKYPVIRMDFSKISGQNEGRFINSLRLFLSNLYADFRYLATSAQLTEDDQHEFDMVRYKHFDMNFEDVLNKGELLTKLLYYHHGRKCIILIDEYDAPVMEALMSTENNKPQVESISNNLGALVVHMIKENDEFVERALITSDLKVGANCFPRIHKLKHRSIFEGSTFCKYFGFTDEEVKSLLKKFNFESNLEDVKRWYGGYNVLGTNEQIYNPFSVLNFLDKRTFGMYWTSSDATYHLSHLFTFNKMGGKMERALDREVSIKPVHEQLANTLCSELKSIFMEQEVSDFENNLAFEVLLESGYFTVLRHDGAGNAIIKVPNYEMKMEVERFTYKADFIHEKYQLNKKMGGTYIIALITLTILEENVAEFAKVVSEIFRQRLPDNAAQMSRVLAYLPFSRPDFKEIASIEYVGKHKLDTLTYLVYIDVGIIIESTYINSTSYDALKKILDNKYYEMCASDPKITSKILIGLHLDEQRNCTATWLLDSLDISKAKNVTVGLTDRNSNNSNIHPDDITLAVTKSVKSTTVKLRKR